MFSNLPRRNLKINHFHGINSERGEVSMAMVVYRKVLLPISAAFVAQSSTRRDAQISVPPGEDPDRSCCDLWRHRVHRNSHGLQPISNEKLL